MPIEQVSKPCIRQPTDPTTEQTTVPLPAIAQTVTFTAPRQVAVLPTLLPPPDAAQTSVRTTYTAVSTGTELLLYNDTLPPDLPLDASIPTQSAPPRYPTPYGYAAVGHVMHSQTLPIGQPVFAFREHTSSFTSPTSSLHLLSPTVAPLDAVFFPSVETALSLAADAAPTPGDTVVIAGQGVIGLLLTAVLTRLFPYSRIITLEPRAERRALSLRAGAAAALNPTASDFHSALADALQDQPGADVSVDVSGVAAGLDGAIAATRDHGRVVVGSWFGTKPVALSVLGGRFHRSHMTLVASQVSHVPPGLSGRWSKERRNALAWRVLEDIRPSRVVPMYMVAVQEASRAYSELADGRHLQVVFQYS